MTNNRFTGPLKAFVASLLLSTSRRLVAAACFAFCFAMGSSAGLLRADTPPEMKWIPAGEFTMGTNDSKSMPNERPAHRVKLDAFWIDEHDVTNAEFRMFVHATGYITAAER